MDALLKCLLVPPQRAREVWNEWRARTDINALPYAQQQLLPALSPRLSAWLEDDPDAGIFQGIVRMVWTQNQLRLSQTAELAHLLEQAGIERAAVAGPAAWALHTVDRAVRVIPYLSFLVARAEVEKAAGVLARAGWRPSAEVPSGQALDWSDHLSFVRENLALSLCWRLIPVAAADAAACEDACLTPLSTVRWRRQNLLTISPEATLLHMLCGRRDFDFLPWQADVALLDTRGIDWERFHRLAARFCPDALTRLRDLDHGDRLGIPELPANDPARGRKLRLFWNDYRGWMDRHRETPHWRGFARFLAARWRARSVWQVPWIGARRAFQHGRSLLR
jgi:Uncharacterised nucleotidyltransferase